MNRLAHSEIVDETAQAAQERAVVVAHALSGERDTPHQQQMCVEPFAAYLGQGADGGVLALPRRDLRHLTQQQRVSAEGELLAQGRRPHALGIEAVVIDAVVDPGGDRRLEPVVEAARRVVGHGHHRRGGARHDRANAAPERGERQTIVRTHDHGRRAGECRRHRHEPGAKAVGVDHVRPEAPGGPGHRDSGGRQLTQPDRRVERMEAHAQRHLGKGEAPHLLVGQGRGQRPAGRAGHADLVLVAQLLDQAHQRHLRAAPRARVVDEEDPHGATEGRREAAAALLSSARDRAGRRVRATHEATLGGGPHRALVQSLRNPSGILPPLLEHELIHA